MPRNLSAEIAKNLEFSNDAIKYQEEALTYSTKALEYENEHTLEGITNYLNNQITTNYRDNDNWYL